MNLLKIVRGNKMEEKEQPKEEVKEEPKENLTVDKAEELVKKMEELLKREEELHAKRILGGQSSAGTPTETEEQKKARKDKAGAMSLIAGTGFEHILE